MKTVIVTGACINTGAAIVEKFASENWNVVFTGRDHDRVAKAEETYRAKYKSVKIRGYALKALNEDGSVDEKGADAFFETLDREGIKADALILNAADLGLNMRVLNGDPLSSFANVMNTNVLWNYALIERAGARMRDLGEGSIVFVNSNTAYRAIPDRVAYSASKGAQLGMMRALALDLGKYHIRVNAVLPGMIRTDRWEKSPETYAKVPSRFTPLGDVANGADVADACYYFTAHARNTTGAELTVDGGNMIQLYPIIPSAEGIVHPGEGN